MSRFYAPPEAISSGSISIGGAEAHHIVDVMRLKEGDTVTVFDGTGTEYDGTIAACRRKAVIVTVKHARRVSSPAAVHLTLIQALPKKEKMDMIIEKATELGVSSVIPVVTARTIVDWDAAKRERSVERWRKIATGAAKQSGRADVPSIGGVVRFKDLMAHHGPYDRAYIAALSEGALPLREALAGVTGSGRRLAFAIGPEGDFTPEEVAAAVAAGFTLISLGRRVLKSDTAALAALAIAAYELS